MNPFGPLSPAQQTANRRVKLLKIKRLVGLLREAGAVFSRDPRGFDGWYEGCQVNVKIAEAIKAAEAMITLDDALAAIPEGREGAEHPQERDTA